VPCFGCVLEIDSGEMALHCGLVSDVGDGPAGRGHGVRLFDRGAFGFDPCPKRGQNTPKFRDISLRLFYLRY
jgi:hypothetical protein